MLGIPAMLTHASDWDAYYPDMTRAYLLNTPRIFETVLQVIRSLVSEKTKNALQVYGLNKQEWAADLHKFIDPSQLSPAFGGNKIKNLSI